MSEPEGVVLQVRGAVASVTLNRPGVLNAIDTAMAKSLARAFTEVTKDDTIRVAVLAGAGGRAFSTGGDLKQMAGRDPRGSGDALSRPAPRPGRLPGFDELFACPKPVIAAIDGYCFGGGFELALGCDIRVATQASTFALPEAKRGLMPGVALVNLTRHLPLGEALRLQLTGAVMSTARAHELGLLQATAADRAELDAMVQVLAGQVLACSPRALTHIKDLAHRTHGRPVDQAWQQQEASWSDLHRSGEPSEGAQAFVQGRPPRWVSP